MSETSKKPKKRWFSEKYRLVVVNDNTFQERASLPLSPRNMALLAAGGVLLVGLLIFLFVKLFGGGGTAPNRSGNSKEQLQFIYEQMDSLENELAARDVYIENVKKVLHGEVETEKDVEKKRNELQETENKPAPAPKIPFPEKNTATQSVLKTAEHEAEIGNLVTSAFAEEWSASQMRFVCPLKGIVSDTFSVTKKHFGIDVVAPKSSPIKAVQHGTVIMAQYTIEEGHTIGIQHAGNMISFYKHNSSLLKKMGDVVRAGDAIAIIGNSGERTNGPHLHFELWLNGKPTNPQKYIKF